MLAMVDDAIGWGRRQYIAIVRIRLGRRRIGIDLCDHPMSDAGDAVGHLCRANPVHQLAQALQEKEHAEETQRRAQTSTLRSLASVSEISPIDRNAKAIVPTKSASDNLSC